MSAEEASVARAAMSGPPPPPPTDLSTLLLTEEPEDGTFDVAVDAALLFTGGLGFSMCVLTCRLGCFLAGWLAGWLE